VGGDVESGSGRAGGEGRATAPGYGTLAAAWAGLLLLTALTVAVSRLDLGVYRVWAALAIAAAKGSLVVAVFMHMKYEGRLLKWCLLAALATLAVFIGITFLDVLYR
jgi:cytochrome c oxidase subunit 4